MKEPQHGEQEPSLLRLLLPPAAQSLNCTSGGHNVEAPPPAAAGLWLLLFLTRHSTPLSFFTKVIKYSEVTVLSYLTAQCLKLQSEQKVTQQLKSALRSDLPASVFQTLLSDHRADEGNQLIGYSSD